jgi:hypothetical protein
VKQVVTELQSAVEPDRGADDADAVPPVPTRQSPPTRRAAPVAATAHFLQRFRLRITDACDEEGFIGFTIKEQRSLLLSGMSLLLP